MKISGHQNYEKQQLGFGIKITIHPDIAGRISAKNLAKADEYCTRVERVHPTVSAHFEPNPEHPGTYVISAKRIRDGEETAQISGKSISGFVENPLSAINHSIDRIVNALNAIKRQEVIKNCTPQKK